MADDLSTVQDLPTHRPGPVSRWTTRAGVGLLCLVVGAAALGWLGPTTASTGDAFGNWSVEVTHPRVTRAGMPAPLTFEITRSEGFDEPLTLTLCTNFFDDLDFQNWYPVPSAETASGDRLVYEFDPPPGTTIRIALDARTAPGQFGEVVHCSVTVREGSADVLEVPFTTWRLP